MATTVIKFATLWAFLCCAFAAFMVEAASLPGAHGGETDLAKRSNSQVEGRGITWKLAIEEGGPIIEFNGTLQQVKKQIQAIKPDFKFTPVPLSSNTSSNTAALNELDCLDENQDAAIAGAIGDDIKYLNGLGDARCGDHGGSDGTHCGTISCSWNSAIKWCNMGPDYYEDYCSSFAYYAQNILDDCKNDDGRTTHGQQRDNMADHNILIVVEEGAC
ncbi:hypothetical protein PG994_006707 [Apiospora phragmitis]|uniref:Uncharacterized protein n=1 Tax=Apiospora phragmitis TaxID=2905665 RepID=A0ABR1VFU5_9PEZI